MVLLSLIWHVVVDFLRIYERFQEYRCLTTGISISVGIDSDSIRVSTRDRSDSVIAVFQRNSVEYNIRFAHLSIKN